MDTFNEKLGMNVPNHIAIILDGNGRWAKKRMMPRNFGHSQGCKVIEQTCRDMDAIGVKYFTIYVFSTELEALRVGGDRTYEASQRLSDRLHQAEQ